MYTIVGVETMSDGQLRTRLIERDESLPNNFRIFPNDLSQHKSHALTDTNIINSPNNDVSNIQQQSEALVVNDNQVSSEPATRRKLYPEIQEVPMTSGNDSNIRKKVKAKRRLAIIIKVRKLKPEQV